MKKIKLHLAGVLLFAVALLGIFGSTSSKNSFEQNKNHWLPADFNPSKDPLLIEKSPNEVYQTAVEDYMQKTYTYKYTFIAKNELKDYLKNNATGEYPYVLRFQTTTVGGSYSYDPHSIDHPGGVFYDYYFYNILAGKKYSEPMADSETPLGSLKQIIGKIMKDNGKP